MRRMAALLFMLMSPLAAESPSPLLVGADLSLVESMEKMGVVYRDFSGAPTDPLAFFASQGYGAFRLRLFVNPTNTGGAIQDLPMGLRYASRVKKAGAKLLLDLHYSDTWADPGNQHAPAAWKDLDEAGLERKVESWTRDVLAAFRTNGTEPEWVQVGNEITPGMLWPLGRNNSPEGWDRLARFLKAGVRGLEDEKGRRPKVVLHIDKGGKASTVRWFYGEVVKRDVPFDLIGVSFYPWWHGTLSDLKGALLAARDFGKPAFVAETAWPFRDPEKFSKESEKKNMEFPISPEGQVAYYKALTETIQSVPGAVGYFIWAPEAIRARWYGGANCLFEATGKPLPALKRN